MVKVSVVIPVYNTEKYIGQCLESLINQTFPEIEIICVDDGSTDYSVEIIRNYQKKDNRIIIIQQKNQYAGIARNNGMASATGEYIIFLDSDDFFELDMIEKLYNKAKKADSDICFCDMDHYREELSCFDSQSHHLHSNVIPDKNVFSYRDIKSRIYQLSAPGPCALYKTSFIKDNNVQFEGTRRGNDLRFWGISIVAAKKITVVNEQLIHYRVGHIGHLQSRKKGSEITEQYTLEQIKTYLEKEKIYDEVKDSFKELVMGNNHHVLHSITDMKSYIEGFNLILKNNDIVNYDGSEQGLIDDMRYRRMCSLKRMGRFGVYRINLSMYMSKIKGLARGERK